MDAAAVTSLVNTLDFGPIVTGMLAIAAAVAGVLIARRSIRMILSAIRS